MSIQDRDRSSLTTSIRAPLAASALLIAGLIGSGACGGQESSSSSATGTSSSSDATGSSSSSSSGGGGGGGGATTSATGGGTGPVMLACGNNLAYIISCTKTTSTYTVCSDYFGNHDPKSISAQCVAGDGTTMTTPCALQDRAGACVFESIALPDRCYVEHVSPPSGASFWEMTCPAVGGVWVPAG